MAIAVKSFVYAQELENAGFIKIIDVTLHPKSVYISSRFPVAKLNGQFIDTFEIEPLQTTFHHNGREYRILSIYEGGGGHTLFQTGKHRVCI